MADPEASSPPLYQLYERLEDDQIRLLTVRGTELVYDDAWPAADLAICCEMEVVTLKEVRNPPGPSYAALSYVWGSQLYRRPVRCNGHTLLVTANLHDALWHLLFDKNKHEGPGRPEKVWVDAICIDQGSNADKSQQVAKMGQIYRRAETVIVWLGSGVDRAGGEFEEYWRWISQRMPPQGQEASKAVKAAGQRYVDSADWFARLWTLQEIVLARTAEVRSGHRRVGWDRFVARNLLLLGDASRLKSIAEARENSASLNRLIMSSAARAATVPHDEIYALLGIYSGTWVDRIVPDYSLPMSVVRKQAAAVIMGEFLNLDIAFQYADCLQAMEQPQIGDAYGLDGKVNISISLSGLEDWSSASRTWYPSRSSKVTGDKTLASLITAAEHGANLKRSFRQINFAFCEEVQFDGKFLQTSGAMVGRCLIDRLAAIEGRATSLSLAALPECITAFAVGNLAEHTLSRDPPPNHVSDGHTQSGIIQDPVTVMRRLREHDESRCDCSGDCKPGTRNAKPPGWPQKDVRDPWEDEKFQWLHSDEVINSLIAQDPDRHFQLLCCVLFGSRELFLLKPIFLDRDRHDLVFELYAVLHKCGSDGVRPRTSDAGRQPYDTYPKNSFVKFYSMMAAGSLTDMDSHGPYRSPSSSGMKVATESSGTGGILSDLGRIFGINSAEEQHSAAPEPEPPMANMSFVPTQFRFA